MPAERCYGMDHPHYEWSPIVERDVLRWPDGKPVAVVVVILVEHAEVDPPNGSVTIKLAGGPTGSGGPYPDLGFFSHREYGHRVGVFRILEALRARGIAPTLAVDAMAAERYPFIVEHAAHNGAEIVTHGISASRLVTSQMSEAEETAYIAEACDRVAAVSGSPVEGWMGPNQAESTRTPQLLDRHGIRFTLDWSNDDQPFLMSTPNAIVAVPPSHMVNDQYLLWNRITSLGAYAKTVQSCFDVLADEGQHSGRSLVLVVRPWITGQPFRIGGFEDALDQLARSGRAWFATAGEVARAAKEQLF